MAGTVGGCSFERIVALVAAEAARYNFTEAKGCEAMREKIAGAVVSALLGAILTACAVLFSRSLGGWRIFLWIVGSLFIAAVPVWLWLVWRAKGKDKAKLSLSGPHLLRETKYKNKNRWRIKVHNRGPAAARHVLVRLVSATTPPRYARWTGDYPYPVYPVGTITNDAAQTSNPQRQINPNSFQDYEIISGAETEEGKLKTSLNTKGGGINFIFIDPDERWRLGYEVTSENANQIHFTLEIFVETNQVKVSMVDAQAARRWARWVPDWLTGQGSNFLRPVG